jgi:hypothetical protein
VCFVCPASSWLSRRNFRTGERGRWHILCSVQPRREWQACCWLYPKPEYILEWMSRWRGRGSISVEIKSQSAYCVEFCLLKYDSFEQARTEAPDDIAAHVASNGHTLGNPPQNDGWLFLANSVGEDSATRGLYVSLAFFAASIQGWTALRLSSSQALTPASGSPASLMSASIWLICSLLSEMDLMSS